jgi:hypothetical protein
MNNWTDLITRNTTEAEATQGQACLNQHVFVLVDSNRLCLSTMQAWSCRWCTTWVMLHLVTALSSTRCGGRDCSHSLVSPCCLCWWHW